MCQDADNQLDDDRQRMWNLSTRLEKSIVEKEEIKVTATSILQVASGYLRMKFPSPSCNKCLA